MPSCARRARNPTRRRRVSTDWSTNTSSGPGTSPPSARACAPTRPAASRAPTSHTDKPHRQVRAESSTVTPASVSPLLDLPGAVAAQGIDAGVAWHYGNPMIEQRRLLAGFAIVDLSHRGVLGIAGPDRLTWLNSISSQELRGLTPGESTETLLLDPTGRLEYAIQVLDDGAETWLMIEAAELPGLHAWLDRMRFMLRVEVTDHTPDYAVIGTMAADPSTVGLAPAAPGGTPLVWHDPWAGVSAGGYQYAEAPVHPGASWHWTEVLVPRAALALLRDAAVSYTH